MMCDVVFAHQSFDVDYMWTTSSDDVFAKVMMCDDVFAHQSFDDVFACRLHLVMMCLPKSGRYFWM